MLLFTLIYDDDKQVIVEEINNIREKFKSKDMVVGVSESIENKTHFIKFYSEKDDLEKHFFEEFNKSIAMLLYKCLLDDFFNKYIDRFITDSYFFLKNEEKTKIRDKSLIVLRDDERALEGCSIYCFNKKNDVLYKIRNIIAGDTKEINIDGFITFRMKELSRDLESIIDKVVEKYMVEKEYNEFIKLLKYFVDMEESKIDEINIMIDKEGKYTLKDKEGNDLTYSIYLDTEDVKYIESISIDDMLLSWLITNVPEKIRIHNIDNCNNKELIGTIKNVFENKVEICENIEIESVNKDLNKSKL